VADVIVLPRASADMLAIWDYISSDSPRAADRLVAAISAKFDQLRDYPEMGSPRPEVSPAMRLLVHGAYLILYRFDPQRAVVEIVAVVHGARDLGELF